MGMKPLVTHCVSLYLATSSIGRFLLDPFTWLMLLWMVLIPFIMIGLAWIFFSGLGDLFSSQPRQPRRRRR